jgi:hypothetical protein
LDGRNGGKPENVDEKNDLVLKKSNLFSRSEISPYAD